MIDAFLARAELWLNRQQLRITLVCLEAELEYMRLHGSVGGLYAKTIMLIRETRAKIELSERTGGCE